MKFLKCKKCGKMLGVIKDSACPTMCCGEAMVEMVPGATEGAVEKHKPVVTVEGKKVTVVVGSAIHPMAEEHFIEWIAIETKEGAQRKTLKPGEEPKAVFMLSDSDEFVAAYEHCNLHGLWKND